MIHVLNSGSCTKNSQIEVGFDIYLVQRIWYESSKLLSQSNLWLILDYNISLEAVRGPLYSPRAQALISYMRLRSAALEDRIRELCTRLVATQDIQEAHRLSLELQHALHEHTSQIRRLVVSEYARGRFNDAVTA